MATSVLSLLGRCGIGSEIDDTLVNVDDGGESSNDAPAPAAAVKKNSVARSLNLNCLSTGKSKYHPDELSSDYARLYSLEQTVPQILDCLSSPPPIEPSDKQARKLLKVNNAKKTNALRQLHDLTKKGNEHNRVPIVCAKKWDVVGTLSTALLQMEDDIESDTVNDTKQSKPSVNENRRLICWILNNLSIPYENKATMALGSSSSKLLQALVSVIQANLPSSYLCCICFMNLTFLSDAIQPVTLFVTPSPMYDRSNSSNTPLSSSVRRNSSLKSRTRSANGGTTIHFDGSLGSLSEETKRVLENPSSLLRVVERMMLTNSPFLLSTVTSVQGEAIRWACGFIRNVTFAMENADITNKEDSLIDSTGRQGVISNSVIDELCTLISHTEIPRLAVLFVRDSPNPTVKWTKNSLEDISLGIMCNLAQFTSSREALRRAGAVQSLETIEGLPGIHGYRARAIRCSLGALPMQCP
ncbi:predicted protein [Thalassiosira pseudonana CCMP1335]|uniref:Uncharacterized protein n=1 Tax=Thalassiosira pseudonana TaxID=35128 RepID=B8CBH9_THAPS|nr:predicted protein [Thalassiosira pseudonana CCMP1335]EED89322.1 predicted protein [Thalassiosira pseudonana CCMP1335]|eukprot:scaffold1102_cov195-Alexandrium_tamarense.AAC.9